MQKFIAVFYTTSILCLGACHSSKEKQSVAINNTEENLKTTDEAPSFFPVTDFFLGQLKETEGLPVTPLKITITGNRQDSLWLKKEDIRVFTSPFLSPVIDSTFTQNYFVEKSFMDQTINAVTFSYDPKNKLPDSIKLNHWDVYIDPQKNTVQRIYLVKDENIDGKNITTQLTWKVNKWCSIRTIIQQAGKDPLIKEVIMKWDFE
ncbi:MAG: hypothetical protein ABI416_07480 [Ginsengibacter sp.]